MGILKAEAIEEIGDMISVLTRIYEELRVELDALTDKECGSCGKASWNEGQVEAWKQRQNHQKRIKGCMDKLSHTLGWLRKGPLDNNWQLNGDLS